MEVRGKVERVPFNFWLKQMEKERPGISVKTNALEILEKPTKIKGIAARLGCQ